MKLNESPYNFRVSRTCETEWYFEESSSASQATHQFDGILELARNRATVSQATRKLRKFLKEHPWHFDAFTHFGTFLLTSGKTLEAYAFYQTAVALAKRHIPREFDPAKHRIPGGFVQNRPYLRTVYNLMNCCAVLGDFEQAEEIGLELLAMDEADRMGVRLELPKYSLRAGHYDAVISLFESPDFKDTFHTASYLLPLAFLHLGRKDEALKAMQASLHYPRVAKYLLDSSLEMPPQENQWGGWSSGSEMEGFQCAEVYFDFWFDCPGALEMLETASAAAKEAGWPSYMPD